MLIWKDEGTVIQMGEKGEQNPSGITMISHFIICAKPGSNTTGIKLVNVEQNAPCSCGRLG